IIAPYLSPANRVNTFPYHFSGGVMFHLSTNRRPRQRARLHPSRIRRARVLVEELEPRTLLAAAPVASVLTAAPSSFARPAGVRPSAPAPAQAVSTQTVGQSALTPPVTPAVAVQAAAEAASAASGQALATLTVTVTTNSATISATILGVFTSLPPTTN